MKTMMRLIGLSLLVLSITLPPLAMAADQKAVPTGMFELYAMNERDNIGNYITEDFILTAYAMMVNQSVTDMEQAVIVPAFKNLLTAMVQHLKNNPPSKVPVDVAAHSANLNYLSVVNALALGQTKIKDAPDGDAANVELSAVLDAKGTAVSPLMQQKIDYTQFKVRGKYTRTPELKNYFRAMRYSSTVLFPVLSSKATGITDKQADFLTAQACALAELIQNHPKIKQQYDSINENLSFLFGPPDDLTVGDYIQVSSVVPSETRLPDLRKKLAEFAGEYGKHPRIIAGIVNQAALKKEKRSASEVMTGFRLMPLRFTPDSAALQELCYGRLSGNYLGKDKKQPPFSMVLAGGRPVKGFPLALELMALSGSKVAEEILADSGDQAYKGYDGAFKKAKKTLGQGNGLAADHLALIAYWLKRGQDLQAENDPGRRLNTSLGFYTWHRYINILYAKQSYSAVGKSLLVSHPRSTAWIEPLPELYLLLKNQVEKLNNHLADPRYTRRMSTFAGLLERCHEIARNIVLGKSLSAADTDFLNTLDQAFKSLLPGEDHPIVVDIHTDANSGKVLEQALGYPEIVEHDTGKGRTRGALFTHYEFKQDMDKRLTDRAWQMMLIADPKMAKLQTAPGPDSGTKP
ncbi:DUF3160 domain-containing protein [Desulfobacter latus]|uniref:DUF3160 domain-containing protein n=1 Tax=Desulfobacter latus TaxID=2292 RepID=A0A850T4H5_9BACT|nr:DUF3160 domain-containing protein [Desulfobacter latus]NWH05991.1 DUF3160 domain-containing protein [Desulfobacter latus]